MLTPASLTAIRDVAIEDVIGRLGNVKLKKAGSKLLGCCPFHNEKTPSFNVIPAKNSYKCYGCGEYGDGLTFVMKERKVDFHEAAELIADIGGVTLEFEEKINKEVYVANRKEQASLREMMKRVQALYCLALHTDIGKAGLAYWKDKRGYDDDTIAQWGLGYADCNNDVLNLFLTEGLLPQAIRLALVQERAEHHEDFFQSRVTIPMVSPQGDIVGFAARVLDDSKPKYKNSSTTDLYNKSNFLFGLYQAAKGIKELGFASLVEGQLDVISLHVAGLINAVGTCGTALTEEHCKLLKRYTDAILLMRDPDEAGMKATSRDIPLLLKYGFRVDVFTLPEKQDPDTFSKQFKTSNASHE